LRRYEIPIPKSQIPNNNQSPNFNDQYIWKLVFGAYLGIGAWDLEF
jgi:hypothetical protein